MSTSTDETVTKDLVETLEDGEEGFRQGAAILKNIVFPYPLGNRPNPAVTDGTDAEARGNFTLIAHV